MLQELRDRVLWREFYRKLLLLKFQRESIYCPFDENASCNLAPGVSCAEIDCPVWLGVGDRVG